MSWCNITGIFVPFTFEANVNVDVPDYSQPATMCHELSHLRGYMREDEANFIAYLACRNSENVEFQYSGAMLAFVYANNALYSADSEVLGTITAGSLTITDNGGDNYTISGSLTDSRGITYTISYTGPVSLS